MPGMARPVPATRRPPRGVDTQTQGPAWGVGGGWGSIQGKSVDPRVLRVQGPGWGRASVDILLQELSSPRRSRRQDVRHGNPIRQCRGFNSNRECAECSPLGLGVWGLGRPQPPPPQGLDASGSSLALTGGRPGVCCSGRGPRQPPSALSGRRFHAARSRPAANKNAVESVQYGVAGSAAFLECQPRSPQATVKWLFQRDPSDRRREVIPCAPQSCGCGSPLHGRNSTRMKCQRGRAWGGLVVRKRLRAPSRAHSGERGPAESPCGFHVVGNRYPRASLRENSTRVSVGGVPHCRETVWVGSRRWKFCGAALILRQCPPGIPRNMKIL